MFIMKHPYIGKLIEKVAIDQINIHLFQYHLHEPLQSAYTPNHSTETAVIKVTNDILLALDCRQCVKGGLCHNRGCDGSDGVLSQ